MKKIVGSVVKVDGCNLKIRYVRSIFNKKYSKMLTLNSFVRAHSNYEVKLGDVVTICSCAPISKTKKYILVKEEK